jgi:HSP20 family molecular chaperone IbpA
MNHNKNILNALIKQIVELNTIDGGISMTSLKTFKGNNHFVISVKTPGINKFSYSVELINKTVFIYILHDSHKEKASTMKIPTFSEQIPVPKNVNSEEIYAVYLNGELKIVVPYNTENNFKERKITIDYLS